MITRIGLTAGEIWHLLDEKGRVSLSQLLASIDRPKELILMSLGWLAREGHILIEGEGDYFISLRKP